MAGEEPEWRKVLIARLQERDRRQKLNFQDIIGQNNKLLDNVTQLKADNLKLSVENEQLRTALSTGGGKDTTGAQLAISALEKKLLAQQEELTELHKRKGENSQLIVDLNVKVDKQNKIISEKEQTLTEQQSANNSLRAEVQMLKTNLEELKKLNMTMLDEHTALQLAFSALEEKLRGVQVSNKSPKYEIKRGSKICLQILKQLIFNIFSSRKRYQLIKKSRYHIILFEIKS
ncbi:autophagy-related protein 16-1-like [Teleopsis dalmanni]|uniref:autophagy-related protein 16-1-like n=1 Tax=Teleopsis dalmanni TaxID=139649 RepID=UPI0018CCB477|nr:autophagy-related protein 16-1-like [Teleopsis dalmanni]